MESLDATAVLVEQPNTLFHHILDMGTYPGVTVVETSTSALGDVDRAFMSLELAHVKWDVRTSSSCTTR